MLRMNGGGRGGKQMAWPPRPATLSRAALAHLTPPPMRGFAGAPIPLHHRILPQAPPLCYSAHQHPPRWVECTPLTCATASPTPMNSASRSSWSLTATVQSTSKHTAWAPRQSRSTRSLGSSLGPAGAEPPPAGGASAGAALAIASLRLCC